MLGLGDIVIPGMSLKIKFKDHLVDVIVKVVWVCVSNYPRNLGV